MVCIYCSHKTSVSNSRTTDSGLSTWRRRSCSACGSIVTTRETYDLTGALRVDGTNLPVFMRDRLYMSLHRSLMHRKDSITVAGELTDTVIVQLLSLQSNGLIDRDTLVRTAGQVLERFDSAAAVSYRAYH